MSEVKAISFGFENCESVEIPIEYVYTFNVNGITKSRSYYQGLLHEYTVTNKLYVSFQKSFSGYEEKTSFGSSAKERLEKYNDICWFDIIYDDGTKDTYQVAWSNEEDQYSNSGQNCNTDFYGHFVIEVGYE